MVGRQNLWEVVIGWGGAGAWLGESLLLLFVAAVAAYPATGNYCNVSER